MRRLTDSRPLALASRLTNSTGQKIVRKNQRKNLPDYRSYKKYDVCEQPKNDHPQICTLWIYLLLSRVRRPMKLSMEQIVYSWRSIRLGKHGKYIVDQAGIPSLLKCTRFEHKYRGKYGMCIPRGLIEVVPLRNYWEFHQPEVPSTELMRFSFKKIPSSFVVKQLQWNLWEYLAQQRKMR